MRRISLLLCLVSILVVIPSSVSAASSTAASSTAAAASAAGTCSVRVVPPSGNGKTVFRIKGKHFPAAADGGALEVEIDITHPTRRDSDPSPMTIMWLWLIPGGHRFYVDYNDPSAGNQPLAPGRYLVYVETPHQAGCRTVATFTVTG